MDKIEKIRQKIKELRELLEDHNYYLDNSEQAVGYSAALDDIEKFLDTPSEEPDKSLEEEYMDYVVSDPVYTKLVNRIAGLGIARHFAEWQKERDQPICHGCFNRDEVFMRGMKYAKEQMMKEAVEGIVTTRSMAGNIVTAHVDYRYKDRQKVRIIVLKDNEDESK